MISSVLTVSLALVDSLLWLGLFVATALFDADASLIDLDMIFAGYCPAQGLS